MSLATKQTAQDNSDGNSRKEKVMRAEYDVIVIGGGPNGLATAYQLSKRGKRTLVVEQFTFLNQSGSSAGVSRQFRIPYPQPYMVKFVLDSIPYWDELQSLTPRALMDKVGTLWFGDPDTKSTEGNIKAAELALNALGIQGQLGGFDIAFCRFCIGVAEPQGADFIHQGPGSKRLQFVPVRDRVEDEFNHVGLGIWDAELARYARRTPGLIQKRKLLDHQRSLSAFAQLIGGGKAVWAAANDNNVVFSAHYLLFPRVAV